MLNKEFKGGIGVNTYTFTEQDREFITRDYEWALEHHISFNGLYATDDIVSINGIHIQFFIHEDTPKEVIEKAKTVAKRERDVVGFSCLIIPKGFPADDQTSPRL